MKMLARLSLNEQKKGSGLAFGAFFYCGTYSKLNGYLKRGATGFDGIKTLINGMRSAKTELNILGKTISANYGNIAYA